MATEKLLDGKLVVVTGGCGLIGRTFVRSIAEAGGTAIIADLDQVAGQKLAAEMNAFGTADYVSLNITDAQSIDAAIQELSTKYGRIDALVNNAYPRNKNYGRKFFDVEYQDFCENIGMNLGGYFLASQKFASYFKEHDGGNIINISSIYGVMAPRFSVYDNTPMTMPVEYAAIKAGLVHLTKYMAQFFKGDHIRVNALSPGGVLDQQPQPFLDAYKSHCGEKGMLAPDDLAGTLLFLLSDLSKYVNGQNIVVDDGFSL